MTVAHRAPKSARLELRVTPDQKHLLEEAAAVRARTVSEFVIETASTAAHDVLADRTRFVLSPEKWDALTAALDRPVRVLPDLVALLAEPSVLDR